MAYSDRERQRDYERRWYERNRQKVYDKKVRKKAELRALVRTTKDRPCADCGNRYPFYVMDFDHVDGNKEAMISVLVNRGGRRRLLAELEKCEVVCANCHRERTWRRFEASGGSRASAVAERPQGPQGPLRLFD